MKPIMWRVMLAFGLLFLWFDATNAQIVTPFQPDINRGGRAVAVTVDPSNTNIAIVASESGGLFKTVDGGETWFHLSGLPMFRLTDVKYAPNSPSGTQIVIASGWNDSRTTNGGGIWRSADGGMTWQKSITSNPPTGTGCTARTNSWGIDFAPDAPAIYVGTDCGLAISTDLGVTWSHVVPNPSALRVRSVVAQSGAIVDICTDLGGHQRSVNGGVTFAAPTGSPGCSSVHGIAASPLESTTIYVAAFAGIPTSCTGRASAIFEGRYAATDAVTWTQVIAPMCLGWAGRAPWVATHRSHDNILSHFDLYFGDALNTWRQICTGTGSNGPRCDLDAWDSVLAIDHPDQNGMAFSTANNCAQFIVSDGGVHHATDANTAICGRTWQYTGNGRNGYNALQLYQVTGQILTNHTDLYIGTQDNQLWASGDSGLSWPFVVGNEGFHIQASRRATNDSTQTITYVDAVGGNVKTQAHFASAMAWSNPPGPITGTGNPTLLDAGVYVQWNMPSPPANTLNLTANTGGSWTPVASLPLALRDWPKISFAGDDVTVYQAVRKPGTTAGGDENIGLVKITGLRRTGSITTVITSTADMQGLNSIGVFPMGEGTFVWAQVFGVDPRNPLHLIAADVGDGVMKATTNGGASWITDTQLTDLITGLDPVTGNREFRFNIPPTEDAIRTPGAVLQPHAIAFDPFHRNTILVGTEAAGIFRSTDGGLSWEAVPGSRAVVGITSFFFIENSAIDPLDTVLVSTYGRGLWKLRFERIRRPYLFEEKVANPWSAGVIRDRFTPAIITLEQFLDPDFCPICLFAVLTQGSILDLQLNQSGAIEQVFIDGGHFVGSDVQGQAMPINFPIQIIPGNQKSAQIKNNFEGCPACLDIIKQGGTIKGIITKQDILFAVIAAFGQLPGEEIVRRFDAFPPPAPTTTSVERMTAPYIQLIGSVGFTGQATALLEEKVWLYGSGFSNASLCTKVSVTIDNRIAREAVQVDETGNFQTSFTVEEPFGRYRVRASQTCGEVENVDTESLVVLIHEEEEEEEEQPVYLPTILR